MVTHRFSLHGPKDELQEMYRLSVEQNEVRLTIVLVDDREVASFCLLVWGKLVGFIGVANRGGLYYPVTRGLYILII